MESLHTTLLSIDTPQPPQPPQLDLTKQEAKKAVKVLEASVEWLDSEVFAVQAHLLLLLNSHAALQSRLSSLPQGAAARQRCLLLTDLE